LMYSAKWRATSVTESVCDITVLLVKVEDHII
jgi:hypothetical protein